MDKVFWLYHKIQSKTPVVSSGSCQSLGKRSPSKADLALFISSSERSSSSSSTSRFRFLSLNSNYHGCTTKKQKSSLTEFSTVSTLKLPSLCNMQIESGFKHILASTSGHRSWAQPSKASPASHTCLASGCHRLATAMTQKLEKRRGGHAIPNYSYIYICITIPGPSHRTQPFCWSHRALIAAMRVLSWRLGRQNNQRWLHGTTIIK